MHSVVSEKGIEFRIDKSIVASVRLINAIEKSQPKIGVDLKFAKGVKFHNSDCQTIACRTTDCWKY